MTDMYRANMTPTLMLGKADSAIRELDRRRGDGIEVALLWNSRTNRVSVYVAEERTDSSFQFEVEPSEALDGFRHPYAYIGHQRRREVLAA